jgi:hypothetical protein
MWHFAPFPWLLFCLLSRVLGASYPRQQVFFSELFLLPVFYTIFFEASSKRKLGKAFCMFFVFVLIFFFFGAFATRDSSIKTISLTSD